MDGLQHKKALITPKILFFLLLLRRIKLLLDTGDVIERSVACVKVSRFYTNGRSISKRKSLYMKWLLLLLLLMSETKNC
jgi:hypothetical protein